MRRVIVAALTLMVALSGCTRVISKEALQSVDPTVSFAKLRENPDQFIGKHVLLGGRIAAARNTKEGGQLEIVQFNLDDSGMPEDTFVSRGRFLAVSSEFLDTMIYKPGRLITLVGEVKGKKTLPLDEVDYTYPVVAIRELYLWKSEEYERSFYYLPPYYDPYYYGFGYEPFWYRPYGPVIRRW